MFRPSFITLIAVALLGLLFALVLLPGIAGLLEGDFKYLNEQFDDGWHHKNNVTLPQSVGDIYAWSFWRVGLRSEPPDTYEIYEFLELIKSSTITGSRWQSYPAPPEPPESLPSVVTEPEPMN